MFLIDSNIIVYSYLPQYEYLRELFAKEPIFVSEISRVEVLGYHKLTNEEEIYFKDIFNFIPVIFPSQVVFDTAITIRKAHNLKLGRQSHSCYSYGTWFGNLFKKFKGF